MTSRRYSLAILFVLVLALPAQGQWLTEVSFGSTYDSNADALYRGDGAQITQAGIRISHPWAKSQVYYEGSGFLFGQFGQRTFAAHQVGGDYVMPLGHGRNRLYMGFAAASRLNRTFYNLYDYAGATGYVQGKWYVRPTLMARAGYTFTGRSYWHMDISRYVNHSAFVQLSRFLPSRTTLQADAGFGYRLRDRGESQFLLGLQVAQSLSDNVGIRMRYQARLNTTSGSAADDLIDQYLAADDPLRDRYDYGGHEWTVRLTQQFPYQTRAVLEGGYEVRSYVDQWALDLNGDLLSSMALRKDRLSFFDATLELPLTERVTSVLGYGFTHQRSNDIYYDYGARHRVSLDFEIGF